MTKIKFKTEYKSLPDEVINSAVATDYNISGVANAADPSVGDVKIAFNNVGSGVVNEIRLTAVLTDPTKVVNSEATLESVLGFNVIDFSNSGGTPVFDQVKSVDGIGTDANNYVVFDADGSKIKFTDDPAVSNAIKITNFKAGDMIELPLALQNEYNIAGGPNNAPVIVAANGDLTIMYNDTVNGKFNSIILEDVLTDPNAVVNSAALVNSALGFTAIAFA